MAQLPVDEYPELALLCWNRRNRNLEEEEAFRLYESGWKFIDQSRLENREQALIHRLTEKYGNGLLNV